MRIGESGFCLCLQLYSRLLFCSAFLMEPLSLGLDVFRRFSALFERSEPGEESFDSLDYIDNTNFFSSWQKSLTWCDRFGENCTSVQKRTESNKKTG